MCLYHSYIGGTFVCTIRTFILHDQMPGSLQDGKTALMLASSEKGHLECVKALLDRGAKVDVQDKVSAV